LNRDCGQKTIADSLSAYPRPVTLSEAFTTNQVVMSIRMAGAYPLGLTIETSDIDVICCASTSARWRTELGNTFGKTNSSYRRTTS
jgi:hypothetical protein